MPTARERAGDFSQSLFARPINPFTGQRFPGDQIPEFFQNPIGRAIANLYPLPNRDVPFQNFVSSPNRDDDGDLFDARVDHQRGGLTLTGRYSLSDRRCSSPSRGRRFRRFPDTARSSISRRTTCSAARPMSSRRGC